MCSRSADYFKLFLLMLLSSDDSISEARDASHLALNIYSSY